MTERIRSAGALMRGLTATVDHARRTGRLSAGDALVLAALRVQARNLDKAVAAGKSPNELAAGFREFRMTATTAGLVAARSAERVLDPLDELLGSLDEPAPPGSR